MQIRDVNDIGPALDSLERAIAFSDDACGLRGFLVLDDLRLGPAAGGVRTRRYAGEAEALADAARLARAMTYKCSLGGVDAGGGKCVVMDSEALDRPRAFEALGELIESLGGQFRTAGDLGTTAADLAAMARTTQYVVIDETGLADAVARGLLRCVEVCAERGEIEVAGATVAVQGCGAIGAAVARALAGQGAHLIVADVDAALARSLAAQVGGEVGDPATILRAGVDIVAPCAIGGVLDAAAIDQLQAWAVCGAANNVLVDDALARRLIERDILFVPDIVASAGAVIHGVARTVMQLADPAPLIDHLGPTARLVFDDAERFDRTPVESAIAMARFRIGAATHMSG